MFRIIFLVTALIAALLASCSSNDSPKQSSKNELGKGTYYKITVNDRVGFIDANGKIKLEPQFDDAYDIFTEDVCYAEIGNRKGLIDIEGNFIVELADTVTHVNNFINGFAKYRCGLWRTGIINKEGKVIIPAIHKDVLVNTDADNLYFCIIGSRKESSDWFMTDKYGNTIGPRCDSINYGFKNGLCPVKIDNKWGYMNTLGEIIIQPQYDYAETFADNDLASVKKEDDYIFIDKIGNQVLKYDYIFSGFYKNRACVLIDGEKHLINKYGDIICKIDADEIHPFRDDNYALVIKDNKASLIDTLGNVVLATDYEFIGTFNSGLAEVEKEYGCGFIDMTGREIIPIKPDVISRTLPILDDKTSPIRALFTLEEVDNNLQFTHFYYDLQGNLIWQDIHTSIKKSIPDKPKRNDFVEYFDSRLGELDPIEGIYYVTFKTYYQDRYNLGSIGLNNTKSTFYAIAKTEDENTFMAHCIDGTNRAWVNQFVKLGETNNYAIVKRDKDSDYSSEGRVTIDNPEEFDFRLEQGNNGYYNFFVTYEFVRDYPAMSEYEKIMKAEWTGSGFAIADGYIATNYHVTSGANTILVRGINGNMNNRLKGYVVASDKEHDISIIKIVDKDFESFGKIPYVVGKALVDVGDNIFVLGYPMTDTMGEEIKLTDGIISAGSGYKGDVSMYQISAAVQPGNSGGPVFNSDGNVIGIVCGKHSNAENANYAIKTSYLYSLLNSANIGIVPIGENNVKNKELSKKVEQLKNYVYIIECSSR
jgi:S1-C subfamily serine protease